MARPGVPNGYERGLVSDYYEVRSGYRSYRPQGTLTSYLAYCTSGRGFVRDERDRTVELQPGDMVLIEPQVYQEYGLWPKAKHWHCHWVHFDAQAHWTHWLPLAVPLALQGVSFVHIASRARRQQLSELFFELHSQRARPEVWRHALSLNLLERILIFAHNGETRQAMDPRIRQVLVTIETTLPPLGSPQLARVAGLSVSRFTSLFRQQTGESVLTAINRVRLRAAQQSLQQAASDLSEAASVSGFASPYSFSNWFFKQTGLRPGQYRRKWRTQRLAERPNEAWLLPRK